MHYIQELLYLFKASDQEVLKYVERTLHKLEYNLIVNPRHYILAVPKGDCTPVLLTAHMDTVRTRQDVLVEPVRVGTTIQNKHGILGADDRAGVGICLNIARRFKQLPYLLFTLGEETGFTGMKEFISAKKLDKYLDDINALVQFDRRGHNELVRYSTRVPDDFVELFEVIGYEEQRGTSSDVSILSTHYGIAHVNLSAGFYLQHTRDEFLNVFSYQNAIESGCTILGHIKRRYMLDPPKYNTAKYDPPLSMTCGYHRDTPFSNGEKCECCGRPTYLGTYHIAAHGYLCPLCEDEIREASDLDMVTIVAFQEVRKKKGLIQTKFTAVKNARKEVTLKDVPGLNTCPVCGHSENTEFRKKKGDFYCHSCGISYEISNCEKVTYIMDKTTGYYVKHTIKARPAPPKPLVIASSCEMCNTGNMKHMYHVAVPGKGLLWMCKSCLDEAHQEWMADETYNNALKSRRNIPA